MKYSEEVNKKCMIKPVFKKNKIKIELSTCSLAAVLWFGPGVVLSHGKPGFPPSVWLCCNSNRFLEVEEDLLV